MSILIGTARTIEGDLVEIHVEATKDEPRLILKSAGQRLTFNPEGIGSLCGLVETACKDALSLWMEARK